MVFTGALAIPRRQAADMAASIGCTVSSSVTKHTTMLVVGNEDVRRLNGKSKSKKQLDAEAWIAKGHHIQFLCEDDFSALVKLHGQQTIEAK